MKIQWSDWVLYCMVGFLFGLFIIGPFCDSQSKASPPPKKEQVAILQLTEYSRYVVDLKRSMCFIETLSPNGVAIAYIPCYKFQDEFSEVY